MVEARQVPDATPGFASSHYDAMADEETVRLWKVNRTVHEMIRDRVRVMRLPVLLYNSSDLASHPVPCFARAHISHAFRATKSRRTR